jgi:hypothetical protein
MDAFGWLSLAVLVASFMTLVVTIKSGPRDIDIDPVTRQRPE